VEVGTVSGGWAEICIEINQLVGLEACKRTVKGRSNSVASCAVLLEIGETNSGALIELIKGINLR